MKSEQKTMSKYDAAFEAARAVLSDTSVPIEETIDNLRTLMDEIEIMLSGLAADEAEEQAIDEGEEIEEAYAE